MKNILLATALLMPSATLAAPSDTTPAQNAAVDVFHGISGKQTQPYWSPPAGRVTIFNTLGKKPYSYQSGIGAEIADPKSQGGAEQWFAVAITPKTTTTVTEIVEALSNLSGSNLATIALLADNNGSPGKVLQQKTAKSLQMFGACCAVVVDHVPDGIQVTAGQTYWVAAILPTKKEATTVDTWNFANGTETGTSAFYDGTTWHVIQNGYTAFAVFGK